MRLKDAKIGDWVYIDTRHEVGWAKVLFKGNSTVTLEPDANFWSSRFEGEKVIYLPEALSCFLYDEREAWKDEYMGWETPYKEV